jgi:hypothetical protein
VIKFRMLDECYVEVQAGSLGIKIKCAVVRGEEVGTWTNKAVLVGIVLLLANISWSRWLAFR